MLISGSCIYSNCCYQFEKAISIQKTVGELHDCTKVSIFKYPGLWLRLIEWTESGSGTARFLREGCPQNCLEEGLKREVCMVRTRVNHDVFSQMKGLLVVLWQPSEATRHPELPPYLIVIDALDEIKAGGGWILLLRNRVRASGRVALATAPGFSS